MNRKNLLRRSMQRKRRDLQAAEAVHVAEEMEL